MRRASIYLILNFALVIVFETASGQNPFQNLDFENPVLPLIPQNFLVATSNAIPGWGARAFSAAGPLYEFEQVLFDATALDLAAVSFHDRSSYIPILQGNYSVGLQPQSDHSAEVEIYQTGTIPSDALSLRFLTAWEDRGVGVYFRGQYVQSWLLGGRGNPSYLWGADISRFAGETGELEFAGVGFLDDIQFSLLPIPVALSVSTTSNNTLLLSWPAATNAFLVQLSSEANTTNWVTLTNLTVIGGYPSKATLPVPNEPTFFRLISR